jgi:hypothetical protein
MKRTLLALALVATGIAAFAEGGSYEYPTSVQSTLTRAQVVAETREAQRLGLIGGGEITPMATPDQLRAIQLAGERAIAPRMTEAAR